MAASSSLFASNSKNSEDDIVGSNRVRCDVQNLLTQRAIQSFMYLSDSLRDPHSVRWIENFLNTTGSLEYHGVGAGYLERFGGTWEAPLEAMMQAEKGVVIVAAKRRGRGHGGWSKDNPFLEERFVEFEIDIDPVRTRPPCLMSAIFGILINYMSNSFTVSNRYRWLVESWP